jgi:hypothetical protein
LFADLIGSMELLADRDPGEARKILGRAVAESFFSVQALTTSPEKEPKR